ncbi:MAG: outer membrane beta-barrel protein [Phycisphaerae bacterium]|nr:outer membrane beta-barrel protein [Phycisphaerae bacterium]
MKRSLIVLAVASLVFAGVVSAEVKKGDVFLDFSAGWTHTSYTGSGGNDNLYYGSLRPGIALTDNIRVAADGGVSYDDGQSSTVTTWLLGVSGEYVFMPASQLNPYVGGLLEWASSTTDLNGDSFSSDGWLWGPRVGALYTLNRTNNLFGEFQYLMWEGGIRKDGGKDSQYGVMFGIEHKFKTGQ